LAVFAGALFRVNSLVADADKKPMTIDTLEYAENLRAAGVSEPAAKAHAEALKKAIADSGQNARAESQHWRNGMEKELERINLRLDKMDARLDSVDNRVGKLERKSDVLLWMGGVAIALLVKLVFFG
jgi:division protein CdvB (Snf7/Vps24/ESCRT-III family)